ncbi:nucleoside phosphatase GDA1/CD39, partial [Syncephalis plumigaleata]
IIDAGSSGSRLLAFHWETIRPREGNITVLPLMDEKGKQYKEKVRPGLSAQTPESVAEHLAPLINKAKEIIPKEKHESTTIFLKATAGMRLVPMAERKRLIDAVSAYFSDKTRVPFSFDSANNAQVIPGEDEGAFGWISVNTLLGNLKSSDVRNTVAALDLGGASTQITFRPTTTPLENSYNIWLNSRKYDLYTHSYLRLGVNEARSRYIAALMAKRGGNNGNAMNDPCMYRDLTQDYPLHGGNTVKLVGQGQFDACYQAVKSTLLGRNTFCATEPCAINGVHQPDIPE